MVSAIFLGRNVSISSPLSFRKKVNREGETSSAVTDRMLDHGIETWLGKKLPGCERKGSEHSNGCQQIPKFHFVSFLLNQPAGKFVRFATKRRKKMSSPPARFFCCARADRADFYVLLHVVVWTIPEM